MKKPDISTRFCQLTARYGYKRGLRQLQREYNPDDFAAFATETRRTVKTTQATQGKADPLDVKAAEKHKHLFANVGE